MSARYTAPWWLPGGHLQTIWPLARKNALPPLRRERVDTPDGDFVDFDWLADAPDDAPLLALFHGLEGSSRSHYARSLLRAAAARGWRAVVAHFRGCSGEANRLTRAYHSGDSDEIDWMLARFRRDAGSAPLFAVGVSLGGNALLKWLGERADSAHDRLGGAAAVCPPLDLTVSGDALARGFNRIYTRHFLATLKPKALAKLALEPDLFDRERMLRAATLRDFDDVYTAPVHGFRDADDYWTQASSRPWLTRIAVPTLLLTAVNDPFVPAPALPSESERSSAVHHHHLATGGHVGFVSGRWPGHLDWLPQTVLEFFARSHLQ
ncbi:MAG: hydrolase [Azoarcus sp.]|nr:hydrolase [Azoarcus sp.]